jgi:hypothetical protein
VILEGGKVGNDAGWHLAFYTEAPGGLVSTVLSIGAGDYHADVEASLPGGLAGGSYRFAVEGITNAHYQRLHELWTARPKRPLFVDLYLYWRDTIGALGYLASVAGLSDSLDALAGTPGKDAPVARVAVTRLARRVGARRYEMVVEARERVFEALGQRLVRPVKSGKNAVEAAEHVARALGVDTEAHALLGVPAAGPSPSYEPDGSKRGLRLLADLEGKMVEESRKTGLGMYVIRDGKLIIGPGRKLSLAGKTIALDEGGGLVHVETSAQASADQASDSDDPTALPPPVHLSYSLTLKGRPDLRPGDMVSFSDPFSDGLGNLVDPGAALGGTSTPSGFGDALAGLLGASGGGALAGGAVTMYVTGVSHKLSRTDGFVTTLVGLGVQPGHEWDDLPTVRPGRAQDVPSPPAASTHDDLAGAFHDLVRSQSPEGLALAEVRAVHASGAGEPPGQTLDVWTGQVAPDGKPHGVRRLAVDREHPQKRTGVPYATPFAWGKCGLVLPRYPGTRVRLGQAGPAADEPVDLGAIWESGHGPDSEPGDWWLILPAAVEEAKRQSLADGEEPVEPAQAATNDLIAADGTRTIEVGRLTVRVQPKQLGTPGQRPAPPGDDAEQVTIEHENGSRIVIKENGDIVISSEKDLKLASKGTMTLEANKVEVKVATTMDVS